MFLEKFNNFRFIVYFIYTDFQQEENFHFVLGDLFNIDSDLILSEVDQTNLSLRNCQNCKNFIIVDIRKLFSVEQTRRLWNEICLGKKEKASGDIMLRKGTDFDILYFDINIDRFYPAPVRLWLQNHPAAPSPPLPPNAWSISISCVFVR